MALLEASYKKGSDMNFIKELLNEPLTFLSSLLDGKSSISTMRFMCLLSLLTSILISQEIILIIVYLIIKGEKISDYYVLIGTLFTTGCGLFISGAFGGKWLQKKEEVKNEKESSSINN
jgi:hypothetical protein